MFIAENYVWHSFLNPLSGVDAIERTSILLRFARRIFAKIGTQGKFGNFWKFEKMDTKFKKI